MFFGSTLIQSAVLIIHIAVLEPLISTALTPPDTSLATIPVVYFGGVNASRPKKNLEMLSKMRVVGVEKWEGPCWSDCLYKGTNCGPNCGVEQYVLDTLKAVKELNPAVSTFFYWNTLLDFNFYSVASSIPKVMDSNTKKPLILRNDNGLPGVYVFDYAQQTGRDGWYDYVVNLTKTGYVDGTFADKYSTMATQNSSGGWQICNHWCGGVTEEEAIAWNDGKNATVEKTLQFFNEHKTIFFHGNTEFVKHKDLKDPVLMINTIKSTLDQFLYAWVYYAGDQKWGHDPNDVSSECTDDNIAIFLLAVEEGAFLECNGWDEQFAKPLGNPLGPATTHGNIMNRTFASGTFVTWDLKKKTGTINWAA